MIKTFENRIVRPSRVYLQNDLFRRFSSVLGIDILVKASGFILLPVYLRLMSQDEFGLYNYLLSIIQTFAIVLNFGLYIPMSKWYHNLSSNEEKGSLNFTILLTLLFFLAIIFIPVLFTGLDYKLVHFLFEKNIAYHNYRGIVILALVITVLSFMLTSFLYTSEKIRQVKTYNVFRIAGVNAAVLCAMYFLRDDAVGVRLVFTYITELLIFGFFAFYLVKELVPRFDLKLMKKSISMGFPVMISAIFGIVVNFSDKFLLQKYGTLRDLSNYYLAFSFASIIPLIFASLQNVWLPIFMKEQQVDVNFRRTKKLLSQLLLFFVVLAILVWCLFVFLQWIDLIPEKYSSVAGVLPILLATQIAVSLASIFGNYLVYFEKTIWVSVAGFIVSLVSIGLGVGLIPVWGIYGAAVTTFFVNLIYLGIYYGLVYSIRKRLSSPPTQILN